ncbi:MAG: hypothetical protein GC160_02790 [Acidobacteria bacterium]|nr:hypothetical protein [Acidobacteriota bacterium]
MRITTEVEAAAAMRALRGAEAATVAAEAAYRRRMAAAEEKAAARRDAVVKPLEGEVVELFAALQEWAKRARAGWGDKKSIDLAGGKVGFRKGSDKLEIVHDKAGELVLEKFGADYAVTTVAPKIAEIKRLELGDAELAQIGLKRTAGKEKFFVETGGAK